MATPASTTPKSELVTPIPLLDKTLTPIFFLECIYAAWFLYTRPDEDGKTRLLEMTVGVFIVMALIFLVKPVASGIFLVIRNKFDRSTRLPIPLKAKSMNKFSEQSWQFGVHVAMTCYSLYVMRPDVDDGRSWWEDTRLCYVGPGGEIGTAANPPLDRMYTTQMSIWIATAICHVWFDEKHKDYYVMYLHHLVTLFLVAFSWSINVKFGFLVLFVHDVSDIGIDLIKMSNYCEYGLDPLGLPVTEVVFVTALVAWVYYRLYQFPVRLISSAWLETDGGLLADGTPYKGVCHNSWDSCYTLRIALCILEVMHIYWTYLLLAILVKGFSKQSAREHYEGRSDSADEDEADHNKQD